MFLIILDFDDDLSLIFFSIPPKPPPQPFKKKKFSFHMF